MKNKTVIVTGAASGFGEGLARGFAARGAKLVCADMNEQGALAVAESLRSDFGVPASALPVNVSDEESVKGMVDSAVREHGGLDVMVSCAGVLKAGGLDDFEKKDFEFVTSVNYTGFFLCAKHAARAMKAQRAAGARELYDIIQINSKSGLEGSRANFAYAGGKFGGIGLAQSFALELAEFGIKVNAICPGNLLDGPLWSDPERGLFKQYLDAGKVKGAKTVEDVRRHYESLVPLGRGCRIEDVVRAAIYIVEQEYETGQALPVTGGQVMLR
ncbi:MAG: SDR family oxidoreductase [Clostridiales Family XIII bacterium]|nr:SDR family oxidoreductase [Clostridiales Family XIII bacterium]